MKKIYIITAILFFNSIIINAQGEDVLDPTGTGLTGFLFVGNELYYTQGDNIFKMDITVSPFSPTLVVDGLSEPTGLLLNGSDLYFAQATANKVSKIDITDASPSVIDVVTGLNEPTFLALSGNDLYIAEIGTGKIIKVDITASLPTTATDVATGLITPLDIELIGNDLYIAEPDGNKISKINITASLPTTATNVVTGLNKPLQLTLNGNDLYIIEKNGNKISKIDITAITPTTASDVLTGLDSPEVIASNASHLYFSENSTTIGFARIARISFSSLSIDDNFSSEKINIYPNPVTDFINLKSSRTIDNASLYNITGQNLGVFTKETIINNKIEVSDYSAGIYFLKIEIKRSFQVIKFIKN